MEKISDCWQTPQWLFDELNAEFNFDIDLCATAENSKCKNYCADYLKNQVILRDNTMVNSYKNTGNLEYEIKVGHICTAFMNPPCSNPKPFIEKAWEDSKHCKIICLVKCDPSTKWWATFWDYSIQELVFPCHSCKSTGKHCNKYDEQVQCFLCNGTGKEIIKRHGPKPGCKVRFFPKRIKFDPPPGYEEYLDCNTCKGEGLQYFEMIGDPIMGTHKCISCKGTGKTNTLKKLSGPTFPCALIIMDRRGL